MGSRPPGGVQFASAAALTAALSAVALGLGSRARTLAFSVALATLAALALQPAIANAYIYWAESGGGEIGRANLDGSDPDPHLFFFTQADDLAVDAGHVYWTYPFDIGIAPIGRVALDSSSFAPGFVSGTDYATSVAVDASHIYWGANFGTIGRADLNGSNVDPSFIADAGDGRVSGVAVDAGHVYWAHERHPRAETAGSAAPTSTARTPTSTSSQLPISRATSRSTPSTSTGRAQPGGHDRPRQPRRFGPRPQLHRRGRGRTRSIAIDAGHVYWTRGRKIGRADLDGTNVDGAFIKFRQGDGVYGLNGLAVDVLTPPDTTIESTEVDRDKRKATFTFSSSQPDSLFLCKLDRKAFKSCDSPRTYKHLAEGQHRVKVKAINAQQADDPSPAKDRFKV